MARPRRTLTGSPAVALDEVARRIEPASAGERGLDPLRAEAARRFPVRFTRYYLDLVRPDDPRDPIRRIAFPEPHELEPSPLDLSDPVGERQVHPVPFVVRKHADRAVLLVTARCHVYCRFCFRRTFPDGSHRDPSAEQLDRAIAYLIGEGELREVILSGGDPLVLPDAELARIVSDLAAGPHLDRLRVHTRAPVHDPARVTPELIRALGSRLPVRIVLHFDHPREITPESRSAAAAFRDAGMEVLNQSVLLRGVNDDAALLEELCLGLLAAGIEPYYLHHPDRVPGASGFYVPIARGLEIHRELARRLCGQRGLPDYVIDLPDGSGKIPVESLAARGLDPEAAWS